MTEKTKVRRIDRAAEKLQEAIDMTEQQEVAELISGAVSDLGLDELELEDAGQETLVFAPKQEDFDDDHDTDAVSERDVDDADDDEDEEDEEEEVLKDLVERFDAYETATRFLLRKAFVGNSYLNRPGVPEGLRSPAQVLEDLTGLPRGSISELPDPVYMKLDQTLIDEWNEASS